MLDSVTVAPPAGAPPDNDRVTDTVPPLATVAGDTLTELSVTPEPAAAVTVTPAVLLTPA